MLNFPNLSLNEFLTEYWQKKPLLIRNAFRKIENHLSGDELAGLAMEEELESRMVIQTPGTTPEWTLKRGPFSALDFETVPKSHWTLLVQGVDRFVPEINQLLNYFDFLPQWRVDDVMISYAAEHGSVGPHYDNYDVFLYQAQGRRKWLLTTSDCVESNYQANVDLRIMKEFKIEHEFVLEEGDMLYLPSLVGHHGISLSKDCMTYSFGYRSYQGQELWDSFGEYLSSQNKPALYYKDPSWTNLEKTSQLTPQAWQKARELMQAILDDDASMQDWFEIFATSLDQQAESLLSVDLPEDKPEDRLMFKEDLLSSLGLIRNPLCRFAYLKAEKSALLSMYINGCKWNIEGVNEDLVEHVANMRAISLKVILPFLNNPHNETFLYELWQLGWVEFWEEGCDHGCC